MHAEYIMPSRKPTPLQTVIDAGIISVSGGSHNHQVLTSSDNPNWETPDWLFAALDNEFDFALDCAADASNHKCPMWLGPGSKISEDALVLPWQLAITAVAHPNTRPAVFVNHPYSRKLGMAHTPWVKAAAEAGRAITVVGVIPYSPQTRWWRKYVVGIEYRATEIRKFPYRIKFQPPADYTGNAPGANVNTAIVIWRPDTGFVDPWQPQERYWDPKGFRGKQGDDGDEED